MAKTSQKTAKVLGSSWFAALTVILFTMEAGWLATTSRFPMAFDESYHFGLIKLFSHRFSPLITAQTVNTYRFGALIHNPSLLYNYLMSFPYRLIELFAKSPEVQVICLRFINVALAIAALLIIRKLLIRLRMSDALANVILLVFAFTPNFTVLSAQISYDNLFIPLVALSLDQTVAFIQELKKNHFNTIRLLAICSLCLFTSLVKYAFLPIFLAMTVLLVIKISRYVRAHRVEVFDEARNSFIDSSPMVKIGLIISILVGMFMFLDVYAVNLVQYHTPVPRCDKVLSIQDCKRYYSWNHNYEIQQYSRAHPTPTMNIFHYTGYWLLEMNLYLYGAILPQYGFSYINPVFFFLTLSLTSVALACTTFKFRKLVQEHPELLWLLSISLTYMAFLWFRNYFGYRQTGQPVAIDGRYILPVLISFYVLFGMGINYAFGTIRRSLVVKTVSAALTISIFLILGGFTQYITHIAPQYGQLNKANDFTLQ